MEFRLTIHEMTKDALLAALSWQVEMGCDEALLDDATNASDYQVTLKDITQSHLTNHKSHQSQPTPPVPEQATNNIEKASPPSSLPSASSAAHAAGGLAQVTNLAALKDMLAAFEGCDLKRTATNLVFSDGNEKAKIMIIGEAPGKDEDRMGVPFVGSAGQLLDQMLASVGYDRTSVYIANIMPWRPPGNRPPTAEEIEMMRPFMEKHIALIQPDIILALGGTACKTLLHEGAGIMKLRGRLQTYQTISEVASYSVPLMPCLHPDFLLRSPQHKGLAFKDLTALRRKADALTAS